MRKWQRGVGIREAMMLTRSLCIYPGYRRVVVLADMTVETLMLLAMGSLVDKMQHHTN